MASKTAGKGKAQDKATPETPALILEVSDMARGGYVDPILAAAVADALKDLPAGKIVWLPVDSLKVNHNSPHDFLQAVRNLLPDRGARFAADAEPGSVALTIVGTCTRHEETSVFPGVDNGVVTRLGFRHRVPTKAQQAIWTKKAEGPIDRKV